MIIVRLEMVDVIENIISEHVDGMMETALVLEPKLEYLKEPELELLLVSYSFLLLPTPHICISIIGIDSEGME